MQANRVIQTVNDENVKVNESLALNVDSGSQRDPRLQRRIDSYSGILMWTIVGYQEKRENAINGTTTALCSPHFYSAQFGYKMCAKIYLNGNGSGKMTHLSLFIAVMQG